MRPLYILPLLVLATSCNQPAKDKPDSSPGDIQKIVYAIHQDYIEGWKNMDKEQIMSLFETDARIQPNSMTPIEGKEKIRAFWFPDDGSVTTINRFETEILSFELLDSIATTTHTSFLDWTYQKDTVQFSMEQKGINTTIYRKQEDNSWKIWRSMWTDLSQKRK